MALPDQVQLTIKPVKEFGANFPIVTVSDWVNSQNLLREELNIEKWLSVAGGSLGGHASLAMGD